MWGDYCEREGHGKFVEWRRKESGTLKKIVVLMRDPSSGQVIAEYIMVMAIGDTKARPTGGTEKVVAEAHGGTMGLEIDED
eukprot:1858781-Prymnesium_polylepis.1